MNRRAVAAAALALGLTASACSGSDADADAAAPAGTSTPATIADDDNTDDDDEAAEFFPDVLDAVATRDDDGTWTFAVTLSSPYDSPEQYADAWRVMGPDGTELGFRLLTHDHATEQPFTRNQSGIEIPDGVTTVTIEGRDQANGWGGDFLEIELPT